MYLTDEELETITNWSYDDFYGLMQYVRERWYLDDWGWTQEGNKFYLSTGGWSGNEDIISALKKNFLFWSRCWECSRRGGHYEFVLPDKK